VPFSVTLPANHTFDTSRPFLLSFTGTVDGAPWTMSMPIGLGIADRCDGAAGIGDYDGIDGLQSPMARLVPQGDPVPFPTKEFNVGNNRPMKLRQLCGAVNLTGSQIEPAEIVALSEAVRGPIDIAHIVLNDDTGTNDPFFRWNDSAKQWHYNMRTDQLGAGTFTVTIRIAGRKDYVTGFVLK